MDDNEAREALRTALADWNNATEEQRQSALDAAEREANRAPRRPRWLERAAGGPNFGAARGAR